jgi:hypothetical protein
VEWTIAIHWSVPLLKELLPQDLYARLKEAYCDKDFEYDPEDFVPLYNGQSGETVQKVYSKDMIRISRRRMRKLCSEGLDIVYQKSIVDIDISREPGIVTAHFADGSSTKGTILSAMELDFNLINVRFDDPEKALHVRKGHPIVALAYHPDGIFSFIAGMFLQIHRCPRTQCS